MPSLDPQLQEKMSNVATMVEKYMDRLLPKSDNVERPLIDAMRYGCLNGGKRLRPFLVVASSRMFNVSDESAYRAAAAIEMVHSFSLIHDDLPCMDNSDLRRGKPTVHKQFNEYTALLAGDALIFHAFAVLGDPETHDNPLVRSELMRALAIACGPHGMCAGQQIDMIGENESFDVGTLTRLQRMKTGELIAAAAQFGAILGRASPPQRAALLNYAHNVGLAFQIVDDILDLESTPEQLGKPVQQDGSKETFVSVLGIDRARQQANLLIDQAVAHLKMFDGRQHDLEKLAQFVVSRNK